MNRQPSLKFNFVMNSILSVASLLFPLITFPYITRVLQPDGTGVVSFAQSFISYFEILAVLGLPVYGIRACAQVRDDREQLSRTAQELLFINLIMAAVSYVLLFLGIAFIPKLREEKILFAVASLSILFTSIGMEWLYKALEQYTYITIRSVVFKLIALVATFLLVKSKDDYIIYAAISIFASSASNLINFFRAGQFITLSPVGGYDIKRHAKPIMAFFAISCATTIYVGLDKVMLGFMTSNSDVGYYNAAVSVKSALTMLVASLSAVTLPRASYYVEKNMNEEFMSLGRKALSFVIVMSIPLVIYFSIFAEPTIMVLAGQSYRASIIPMLILMPTVILIGFTNIIGIQILVPLGKEKTVLKSVCAGAVVDLIVNAALIPSMKSSGAAIGTLIAEIVVFIIQYSSMKPFVRDTAKCVEFKKIVPAIFAGTALSVWILFLPVGDLVSLLVSFFIYFVSYGTVLLLLKEQICLDCFGTVKRLFRKS